jgi:TonB family protein
MNNVFRRIAGRKSLVALAASSLAVIAGFSLSVQAETVVAPSVVAIQDVQPEFPASALRREASGYVMVRFDVDSSGKAKNVKVVDSQPERMFDSAAIRAVRRSEFSITDGQESVNGIERLYRFSHDATADQSLSMK